MATTIIPTDLKVTIIESYTVNGVEYGNSTSKTFSENGEVLKRVMNIDTTMTEVINFGTRDEAGQAVTDDYSYFRISNLDDTNFIRLEVNTLTRTYNIKLNAGDSYLLMSNEMDADTTRFTFTSLTDINIIRAISDTATCDIEVITVTK
tara:strand:- start:574 stop:1020 length:447 start_codon:yes stop_codon:yes gene_type:complete